MGENMEIYPLDQIVADKRQVIGRIGSAAVDCPGGLLVLVPGTNVGELVDAGQMECGRFGMVVWGEKERLALVLTDAEARKMLGDLAVYYSGIVAFETLAGKEGDHGP